MYHSYVMGIDESLYILENQGFEINRDGGNFMVSLSTGFSKFRKKVQKRILEEL